MTLIRMGIELRPAFSVRLLAAKAQDEAKALQLCQGKVRAKKLPMEVVEAEYQWFVSDNHDIGVQVRADFFSSPRSSFLGIGES